MVMVNPACRSAQRHGWIARVTSLGIIVVLGILGLLLLGETAAGTPMTGEGGGPDRPQESDGAGTRDRQETNTRSAMTGEVEVRIRPASQEALLDPRNDGWETEVIAERAKTQLNRILGLLPHGDRIRSTDVRDDVAVGFQCNRLRPATLVQVFGDTAITIRREITAGGGDSTTVFRGARGLAESLRALAEPLRTATDVHVHAKIVRVALETDTIRATALIETSGRFKSETIQQRGNWACRWKRRSDDSMRLVSIQSGNYEEVLAGGPQGT